MTDMDPASSQLPYEPLVGDEIRLLKFVGDKFECKWVDGRIEVATPIFFHREHFPLDQSPPFFALSYVWGDSTNQKQALIDGGLYSITESLFEGLVQLCFHHFSLREVLRSELGNDSLSFYLWVDYLCVNQNDAEERSQQIPRMDAIYSRAHRVLIWLGTRTDYELDETGLSLFVREAYKLHPTHEFLEPSGAQLAQYQDDADQRQYSLKTLFFATYKVREVPWLSRVWVMQEYAAAQRPPWAMISYEIFQLQALRTMTVERIPQLISEAEGTLQDSMAVMAGRMYADNRKITHFIDLWSHVRTRSFQELNPANRLLYLLILKGGKQASVSHDHIYGILSLAKFDHLPRCLTPAYSQTYETICLEYTKFLLQETDNLCLLDCWQKGTLSGLPSWVCDFRHFTPGVSSFEPATRATASLTLDGSGLHVFGSRLQTVLAYKKSSSDASTNMILLQRDILERSARIQGKPFADVWRSFSGLVERLSGHPAVYASMDEVAEVWSLMKDRHVSEVVFYNCREINYEERLFVMSFKWLLSILTFAVLMDGSIIACWPLDGLTVNQGDVHEIWALRGTVKYAILSREAAGYRCVGAGRPLEGLTIPMEAMYFDEAYFAARTTERILII